MWNIRGGRALAAMLVLASLAGCASTRQAPPAAEPVPEFETVPETAETPPKPEPEPPREFVVVTGSSVNLRSGPSTSAASIGKARKGERLQYAGTKGDWIEVRLAHGGPAYIHSRFARRDGACAPDSKTPQILDAPLMDLSDATAHGLVQLKLSVNAQGAVSEVAVVGNSTGDPALADKAAEEARQITFAPLIRNCKATPFVYLFNRIF
jgi:outer membrane biosynthesis protein TonB